MLNDYSMETENNNIDQKCLSFVEMGLQGFEELRKYIKQGNEFCKEVAAIIQERADLETSYAKSLSKISGKLQKATSTCIGTMPSAWTTVALEMEAEAELHRQFSSALHEDIFKPLKSFIESYSKKRKPIENTVDKAVRVFQDKRNEELKTKSKAFSNSKESQKVQEQIDDARAGRGRTASVKDIAKMEKKNKQYLSSLKKSDKEYHELCQKAEGARQEWESTVYKASGQLQLLDEERISQMQSFLSKYHKNITAIGPKMAMSCDKLNESVMCVDVSSDLRMVVEQKSSGLNQSEQFLFECYAEELTNTMDPQRRRQMLLAYLALLEQDMDREQKGKEGVEKLMEVYRNRPNFADVEAQEDAKQRLLGLNSMLNYLDASHYKLSCSLAKIDKSPKPDYKFSQYIEKTKDKQGLPLSILRLPVSVAMEGFTPRTYNYARGTADGGFAEQVYDDDEFDDDYDGRENIIGQCRALYDYKANHADEIALSKGDTINIYNRQEDGWWYGEVEGQTGIFPATYVEETSSHL